MTHSEKRVYLIKELLSEQPQYRDMEIPDNAEEQKRLLRSLMNIRSPRPIGAEFLKVQDEYLNEEVKEKGITDSDTLPVSPINNRLVLWRGDITTLKIDAIVNAANSALRGCFVPCHSCVDNIIHSVSGIQLRLACDELMTEQGYDEPTGKAKITPAFNLPCSYVLHTVGPIRADDTFVQDKGWYEAGERYADFIRRHKGLQVLFLELGVGMNTPSIIKYPFWQMVYDNSDAYYISINYGEAFTPSEISKKAVCIQSDIKDVLFSV